MKQGYVKIKVKPTGKMIMIRTDILTRQVANMHLPENVRYGESIIRSTVLAVGSECTKLKAGDTIYFANGANCAEVEIFARTNSGEESNGQVYILHEDNVPATYEIVEDSNNDLDVVVGLSTEGHRLAMGNAMLMAEERAKLANSPATILRPRL
jgi:hypothetical protein